MNPQIETRPVGIDTWEDLETMFESRGSPHYCWCMAWRVNENRTRIPGKSGKKASMRARVASGTPTGILGYHDGRAIAWCSIAPRGSYRKLGGDESVEGVWSLVCFFVQRPFRNQGVTRVLLSAAIEFARDNGAKYVEAYPVDPKSTTYRYMGLVPAFEEAGFQFKKMAGSKRHVMILSLHRPARVK